MPESSRYTPLKDISNGGIILMKDIKPGETEEIVEPVAGKYIASVSDLVHSTHPLLCFHSLCHKMLYLSDVFWKCGVYSERKSGYF